MIRGAKSLQEEIDAIMAGGKSHKPKMIWKYDLRPGDNTISMPGPEKALAVAFQGNRLCIWCLVTPGEPEKGCHFWVAMTGEELPDLDMTHIGTAQSMLGIVAHVFAVKDA